jgi:Domain of unknown function (DUF4234)
MSTQASTSGPPGHQRGIAFAILLAIVTLGIYTFYWVFKTQDEVREHSGIGVSGVVGLVATHIHAAYALPLRLNGNPFAARPSTSP